MPMRLGSLVVVSVLVLGCAPQREVQVAEALTSPLSDLNLVNAPIPEVLRAAQSRPYAPPAPLQCADLQAQIAELSAVLGPDLDTPAVDAPFNLVERSTDLVIDQLRGNAQSVLPYRKWVRKLSGAERYSGQVAAAVAAGTARRAYLKGWAEARGCAPA